MMKRDNTILHSQEKKSKKCLKKILILRQIKV